MRRKEGREPAAYLPSSERERMMIASEIEDLTVSEIMTRWPATMRLFIDRRLLCVGCPIAPFHLLSDVAIEHGVDLADLVAAVLAIAEMEPRAVPASVRR
jgi:hybrid cluster-associated redox disulfide protein